MAAVSQHEQQHPRTDRSAPSGVLNATGREREEWFAILDNWGAADRSYRELQDWMTGHHGISRWWAQKLIVEYQQERGVRDPGVRPDGTFTVTASKTVAVPVEHVFAAVIDPQMRDAWLPDAPLTERTSRAPKSVRFESADDGSRVNFALDRLNPGKSRVSVEHTHLADQGIADESKRLWRERLSELASTLENDAPGDALQ